MTWRATIALAALLALGLTGTADATSSPRRDAAPEIGSAQALGAGAAEVRRGKKGNAPAHKKSSAPLLIPSRTTAPRFIPVVVLLTFVALPDHPPSRSRLRAVARAPPQP